MEGVVRRAREADATSIAALSEELGYPTDPETVRATLCSVMDREDHRVFVAELPAEGICGWLHAHSSHVLVSGFRVEIAGLVVSGRVRRRGVGRSLVAQAEAWAREISAPTVVVRSNAKRIESHSFYPTLGYAACKTQVVYSKTASK